MAKTLSQIPELKKLDAILTKWEDEGLKPRGTTQSDMYALLYVFKDLFQYKKAFFIEAALVNILMVCGISVEPHSIGFMAYRR